MLKTENLGKNELALAATTCYLTLGKNIKEKLYILSFFWKYKAFLFYQVEFGEIPPGKNGGIFIDFALLLFMFLCFYFLMYRCVRSNVVFYFVFI